MTSPTRLLLEDLLKRRSLTPEDAGCQAMLTSRLKESGFICEHLPFGEVSNSWLRRGSEGPLFVFLGHTDVVPTGPLAAWTSDPFIPTVRDGKLYARGAADMKSGIAAMVTACERFIKNNPHHAGSIAFLITSDEEGASIDGVAKVVPWLREQAIAIDYCLVGEASSEKQLGDTIKIGRRGTLTGYLTIHGKQGHIAYPQLADNPIHRATEFLTTLTRAQWDQGNEFFSPTSMQISNIHAGTGAGNVIPGHMEVQFNFRYSPLLSAENIKARVTEMLAVQQFRYDLRWHHSGKPFLSQKGKFAEICAETIKEHCRIQPHFSTVGGTSDGRFIAEICDQVLEIGPCNASIHQIDEHIDLIELEKLSQLYETILTRCLL